MVEGEEDSTSSHNTEISEVFVTTFKTFLHIRVAMEFEESWKREGGGER